MKQLKFARNPQPHSAVAKYYRFKEEGKRMQVGEMGKYYTLLGQHHHVARLEKELRRDECDALIELNVRPKGGFWSNLFKELIVK